MVTIKISALPAFSTLCLVPALLAGCGSSDASDASDPVSECKDATKVECMKFYECFTDDERANPDVQAIVGTSEADCESKIGGEQCSAAETTCDSGQTYHADKAQQCVKDFQALSCDQFRGLGGATDTPASCNDACS